MKDIFKYEDYRLFLKDHYEGRKAENKSYSFRFFARKAGLDSPNYYKLVMDGQRNLTHKNVKKFSKGLGLGEKESVYFENLVFFNQAKNDEEKEFYAKNLKLARSEMARGFLSKDQYEVMSKWYPLVIKELAQMDEFFAKPKWIAARLDYRITPVQAKEAVELLERLGLIEVDAKTKKINVTQQSLQTPDVTHSDAIIKYYQQMLDLAKDCLVSQDVKERCFSALTVAVNKEDLAKAFSMVHEFRNKLDTFFTKNKKYNSVYQLNMQLFRVDNDVS